MFLRLYLGGKISHKRLMGTLRVLAYGTVVSAGFGALTVRSAVADVNKDSLAVGRKLAGLQDLMQGQQEFRLNGESVFFGTGKTDEGLSKVLDRFETHCNGSHAFDALEWKGLGDKQTEITEKFQSRGINRLGVLRTQDEKAHDGVVMCFTKDKTTEFLTGLQNFAKSGDLHDLGDVRYVHAVTKDDGRTYYQIMWTDGSFNIRHIMGEDATKDTIGSDFANLPRPLHSRRTLTAEALGTPYSARIYESPDAPDAVLNTYIDVMHERGWVGVTSPDVSMEKNGLDGRYFMKLETAEQAIVSVSKHDGKTTIVVAEIGGVPSTKDLKVTAK